ncbi:MAG: hypothetical protein IPJ18_18255 [Betaproteobacteria bacterium]|nr:hypothetical protein [Betaproteobacteria bacterium]
MEKFLTAMRRDLIERAIVANPRLADALSRARSGGAITTGILDILIKAADAKPSPPSPSDHIGQWLRSKVARQLAAEGIQTLRDFKAFIETNGPHWWTPIPRIGRLRAQALTTWLNQHEELAINPATQVAVLPPKTSTSGQHPTALGAHQRPPRLLGWAKRHQPLAGVFLPERQKRP